MKLVTDILIIIFFGGILYWDIYSTIKVEVKNKGKMDEFRKASLLKKIDLMFPKDDDDLLNAERNWNIHTTIGIIILLIYFIIDLFR